MLNKYLAHRIYTTYLVSTCHHALRQTGTGPAPVFKNTLTHSPGRRRFIAGFQMRVAR